MLVYFEEPMLLGKYLARINAEDDYPLCMVKTKI